jgi:hypothetical protein
MACAPVCPVAPVMRTFMVRVKTVYCKQCAAVIPAAKETVSWYYSKASLGTLVYARILRLL